MTAKRVSIVIPNLPEDLLVDFNVFVRVANDVNYPRHNGRGFPLHRENMPLDYLPIRNHEG